MDIKKLAEMAAENDRDSRTPDYASILQSRLEGLTKGPSFPSLPEIRVADLKQLATEEGQREQTQLLATAITKFSRLKWAALLMSPLTAVCAVLAKKVLDVHPDWALLIGSAVSFTVAWVCLKIWDTP